ncbi:hypothetical protein K457DRAFT_198062 [Linnemannia elongata AG-77]|uniref:Secreted protein n=1 Tax=Linnemannia elongata AG-77 TaxID=1314771 RepID=A0A197JEV7_9FUNG|nr:hypothetical protein K457DRAFT_198062 [Linnemannia elongata AG-77]
MLLCMSCTFLFLALPKIQFSGRECPPTQTKRSREKEKKKEKTRANDGRSIRQGEQEKRKLVLITALEEGVFLFGRRK